MHADARPKRICPQSKQAENQAEGEEGRERVWLEMSQTKDASGANDGRGDTPAPTQLVIQEAAKIELLGEGGSSGDRDPTEHNRDQTCGRAGKRAEL